MDNQKENMDKLYRIHQVKNNVWIIGENIRTDFVNSCALIVGEKRAALIDTGCGIGDLRSVVKNLTDKPVLLLTTHVHIDHIGAHSLFDNVYVSDIEMQEWKNKHNRDGNLKERLDFLKTACQGDTKKYELIKRGIVRESNFKYHALKDSMIFDLGGVVLDTVMVPGHTKESFVFVDRKSGIAFTGDSLNSNPWIIDPEISVKMYYNSVKHFHSVYGNITSFYSGHSMEKNDNQIIKDTLSCCCEIFNASNDPTIICYAGEVSVHRCGKVEMFYNKENIF